MKTYELTVILPEKFKEATQKKVLDELGKTVENSGGKFGKVEEWGTRTMAYPIKKQKKGHYYFVETEMDQAKVGELKKSLEVSKNYLRYLMVEKGK